VELNNRWSASHLQERSCKVRISTDNQVCKFVTAARKLSVKKKLLELRGDKDETEFPFIL
jgi:hypothetical protein